MCQKLLGDAKLYEVLLRVDTEFASQVREKSCPACGGPLHRADYPRKPRGAPADLGSAWRSRLSFCCAEEGCRKRRTPPSVRFLGRRVYLGVVVVLATVLQGGLSPKRFRVLQETLEVDRRTVERWRRWWQETLPASRFWAGVRRRFAKPVPPGALPAALLERFAGDERTRLVSVLRLLSPITAGSAAGIEAR